MPNLKMTRRYGAYNHFLSQILTIPKSMQYEQLTFVLALQTMHSHPTGILSQYIGQCN